MANTTNFNWETPDDTDLVKDGAAAIRTLGSSIDTSLVDLKGGTTGQILSKATNTDMDFTWITNDVGDITAVSAGTGISGGGTSGAITITNDMATTITAAGDIVVGTGSGTYDNLPIGTTGQILTADTTVSPYKVKWAAASSGAFTLVKRASFSAVANTGTTFDDVFTSTYSSYLIIVENLWAATATDDPEFQLRYAGPTTMAVQYLGSGSKLTTGGTVSWIDNYDEAQFKLGDETGDSGFPGGGQIFFNGVGNASERATWRGQFLGGQNAVNYYFAGNQYNAQTYTGILFKSSSSNITGTISVYGMAKS